MEFITSGQVGFGHLPVDLMDQHHLFSRLALNREGRSSILVASRMRLLGRPFQIMGIIVPSTDDDQVLEASGQEQLSSMKESQIAGP